MFFKIDCTFLGGNLQLKFCYIRNVFYLIYHRVSNGKSLEVIHLVNQSFSNKFYLLLKHTWSTFSKYAYVKLK